MDQVNVRRHRLDLLLGDPGRPPGWAPGTLWTRAPTWLLIASMTACWSPNLRCEPCLVDSPSEKGGGRMGILVAKNYSTSLFARAADHTYVECSTGAKAWSCWGGKTGGTVLRRAVGSTKRADAIAEPNERAGIKCYLINGVCHQAANRILLPARITVHRARGYSVSLAMFGAYGRVGIWPCHAPFNKHPGSGADLPECVPSGADAELDDLVSTVTDQLDWNYVREELALYEQHLDLFTVPRPMTQASAGTFGAFRDAVEVFHLRLFLHMLDHYLGPRLGANLRDRLLAIRRGIETRRMKLEVDYAAGTVAGYEFATLFNQITLAFQDQMADAMTNGQYQTLFRLNKDERVILADPEISKAVFGGLE